MIETHFYSRDDEMISTARYEDGVMTFGGPQPQVAERIAAELTVMTRTVRWRSRMRPSRGCVASRTRCAAGTAAHRRHRRSFPHAAAAVAGGGYHGTVVGAAAARLGRRPRRGHGQRVYRAEQRRWKCCTLSGMPSRVVLTGERELLVKPEPMVLAELLARGQCATFEQLTGTLTVIPPHAVVYVEQAPPESGG